MSPPPPADQPAGDQPAGDQPAGAPAAAAPVRPTAVTAALLAGWPLHEPDSGGDKHSRGTVVVAGGATSTPGAVLLAGLAALRAGAGRLTVLTVDTTSVPVGVALPEAMVLGLPADERGSLSPDAADELLSVCERAGAVVLGPGLLGAAGAGELLARVLPRLPAHVLVLLDAVALTAVGERPELLDPVRGRVLLTPNSGELAALTDGGQEGPEAAVCVAAHHGAVVATRGWVATPDGALWHNEAGNVGLGTSGSGDVLAGTVGGLLARGAEPVQAAVWGQHLHAVCGDRLSRRRGPLGFLARELLEELPGAMADLRP